MPTHDTDNDSDYSIINNDGSFSIYDVTNSSHRLSILASGNVGIGTTSPNNELEILGSNSPRISLRTSSETVGEALELGFQVGTGTNSSSNTVGLIKSVITQATPSALIGDMEFQTNSGDSASTKMIIKGDGNVGIGTTSPTSLLTLESSSSSPYPRIDIKSTSFYPGSEIRFLNSSGSEVSTIESYNNPGVQYLKLSHYSGGSVKSTLELQDNAVVLQANPGSSMSSLNLGLANASISTAGSNRLYVNSLGNVGIGTTNPLTKLQVGDGTADDAVRSYFNDGNYTEMRGYGLQFSRAASYIRPTADNTKTLYLGSNVAQWNALSIDASTTTFNTNGSENMRITSSGNVGIGTTSPVNKLSVIGDIGYTGVIGQGSIYGNPANGSYATMQLYNGSTGYTTLNNQSFGYYFNTGGGNKLTILNGGNVGIGTTGPSGKLEVRQSANNGNTGAFTNTHVKLTASATADNTGFVGITAATSTSDNYGYSFGAQRTSGGVGNFKINYHNNSAAGLNRFIIDQNGNVGIGTTSPAEKLSIAGGNLLISLYVGGKTDSSQDGLRMSIDNAGNGYIDHRGSGNLNFRADNVAGAATRMVITSGGNVGIGTTSPSEKLHVVGNIKTSGQVIVGPNTQSGSNQAAASFITENDVTIGGAINWWSEVQNGSFGTYNHAVFYHGATQAGSIRRTGNSTVSYNTSSDYRLKENVIEIADGIERVKQLKPSKFNFIGEERIVDGFLAHEVQNVVPESISGEKDEVDAEGNPIYQAIDQSKIVPLLAAALKEAIIKIENLETKIQILENQ
jgi:hypothetical protein